jgi:DNA gyrase subunit B
VEQGYLYIAQPPLYKVKRGKQERYLKDENSLENYLIEKGTENLRLRAHGSDGHGTNGQGLQTFIKRTIRYQRVLELMAKKGRERTLIEALVRNPDFTEDSLRDAAALEELRLQLTSYINLLAPECAPLSGIVEEDTEHNCFRLVCSTRSNGSGIRTSIDRDLLTSAEFKELRRLFLDLSAAGLSPFVVEESDNKVALGSFKEVLDFVMERGKKGQYIQRYKGLGEMNPDQLWETTMDPEKRVLLQVRVEDTVEANEVFSTLMGDQVEPRRKFIEEYALTAKNLDV